MDDRGKWITRGGTFLVLLGFVFPSMLVSCGGALGGSQSFSLMDLARVANQALLYLVPLGMVVMLGLTFLSWENEMTSWWGQLISGSVSLGSMLISFLTLYSQIQQESYGLLQVSPQFGFFILLAGYAACGVGLYIQRQEMSPTPYQPPQLHNAQAAPGVDPRAPIPVRPPQPTPRGIPGPTVRMAPMAYLDVLDGSISSRTLPIIVDDFRIGRSPRNDLRLSDPVVSRLHCRIRFAEGMWFIQDQNSTGGTYVNGQTMIAGRLNNGDEIQIGDTRLRFRL